MSLCPPRPSDFTADPTAKRRSCWTSTVRRACISANPTSRQFACRHDRYAATCRATGHTTTNSAWNKQPGRPASIVTPPFDLDGKTSFSDYELRAIVAIWRAVSEDYAAFDVGGCANVQAKRAPGVFSLPVGPFGLCMSLLAAAPHVSHNCLARAVYALRSTCCCHACRRDN